MNKTKREKKCMKVWGKLGWLSFKKIKIWNWTKRPQCPSEMYYGKNIEK